MQTLNQIQEIFERYLEVNKFDRYPPELYNPVNYILSLGGKRLRPAVLLMSHHLFDDQSENALPAAFAIELFHNFTLMHDDIMDAAPLRRGKPTVHHKYGLNTGILSGDVMLVLAYEYLGRLHSPNREKILDVFNRTAIEVCEGQQMDINFETRLDVSIEEYLRMIELKTSVLVAAAMKIGALTGGASDEDAYAIYEFGRNLGIAFQLQDDLLDAYGDPEKFGKKVGGDIAQNKKTFLYLKALEVADDSAKEHLKTLFSSSGAQENEKIEEVMQLFNQLKIKDLTEEEKQRFQTLAFENLERVSVSKDKKMILERFATALMQREF